MISVCISIHPSIISICLSIDSSYLSIHPSYPSIHPSIHQSYMSTSVSICLPIYPSMSIIYLSIIFVSSMYLLTVYIYLYYLSIVYPSISTCILLSIYMIYLLITCICTYTYICHPSLHPSICINLSVYVYYLSAYLSIICPSISIPPSVYLSGSIIYLPSVICLYLYLLLFFSF